MLILLWEKQLICLNHYKKQPARQYCMIGIYFLYHFPYLFSTLVVPIVLADKYPAQAQDNSATYFAIFGGIGILFNPIKGKYVPTRYWIVFFFKFSCMNGEVFFPLMFYISYLFYRCNLTHGCKKRKKCTEKWRLDATTAAWSCVYAKYQFLKKPKVWNLMTDEYREKINRFSIFKTKNSWNWFHEKSPNIGTMVHSLDRIRLK